MSKIDINKKQKRDSLLNSALLLFNENGFHQTSISDISKKAGVAKGTFYLYFKDKFDLRNKLISHQAARTFTEAYRALDPTQIPELEDQLIFLIDQILNQFRDNPQMMYFLAKHLSWAVFTDALKEAASSTDKYMDNQASEAFNELVHRLDTRYEDPELLIYLILEFTASTSYNVILYEQPVTLEELKPRIFDVTRYMIRRSEKSSIAPAEQNNSEARE